MISHIEHHGKLIHETNLPGERRRDNVAPAHGNGLQLSRNRFMTLVGTRGFRGVDAGRSIVWQLRRDSFSGPVIKESHFARSIDDWYPLGDTYRCRRQSGHPVLFGVPKGARVDGPQANVFVAKWRKVGRGIDPEGHLLWDNQPAKVSAQTQCVEWSQFRLTESADDNGPFADMGKLLPHTDGREQTLIHRVRSCAMATEKADLTAGSRVRQMTEADVDYTAIYHATVVYDQDFPSDWSFAP